MVPKTASKSDQTALSHRSREVGTQRIAISRSVAVLGRATLLSGRDDLPAGQERGRSLEAARLAVPPAEKAGVERMRAQDGVARGMIRGSRAVWRGGTRCDRTRSDWPGGGQDGRQPRLEPCGSRSARLDRASPPLDAMSVVGG